MRKIGYLGPEGTFTHEAALLSQTDREYDIVPYLDIPELIYAVSNGEVHEGVVPVENALEGTVNITVDLLVHETDLKICGEMVLPVHHCLLARPGIDMEDITLVLSHPQALAQCRNFLKKHLKNAQLRPVTSTAAGAREVEGSNLPWAAIGNKRAGKVFGLDILGENIEDNSANSTRFIILSKEESPPTGMDKTSIVFTVTDKPGSLYHALKLFADRGINLKKIESRPMKTLLGQYLFLVDFQGHVEDEGIRIVIEELSTNCSFFKVLGSYPMEVGGKG